MKAIATGLGVGFGLVLGLGASLVVYALSVTIQTEDEIAEERQ